MLIAEKKQIILLKQNISYTLKFSRQAKRLRLAVYPNGDLVITQPKNMSTRSVDSFIKSKEAWIIDKINYFKNHKVVENNPLSHLTRRDYLNKREATRALVSERLEYYNNFYNFKYKNINIRDQKTRWGSCSRQGVLNFNYRLFYLSEPLRDYVIVHELCHLKEFNHSLNFWDLVSKTIPDFKELRKNLKSGQLF